MSGELTATISDAVHEATNARTGQAVATALGCVQPDQLAVFFHTSLAADAAATPLADGLPASPGAASGKIALTAEQAMVAADAGDAVILVRSETTPDDVLGMQASRGILTARGGQTSHAAVVARGWGIPAVVGAADVHINRDTVTIGGQVLGVGEVITIDGATGSIFAGELATTGAEPPPELHTLLGWADAVADGHVQVRANADTGGDAAHGRKLGAQGIGLCRTEHMFLAHDRLAAMRRFILSNDPATEAGALAELEAAQTADFESVLDAMDVLPVTIRLLDPPLHEFLPDLLDLNAREASGDLGDEDLSELAAVRRLHESNPMLGTRGVRLGAVRPGVYQMQVRALCKAAAALFARGRRPHVEIMIPLVVDAEELRIARSWVHDVLDEIGHPELQSTVVTFGAMIETPRSALVAGELAQYADFFSFGTNDLTQMTFAFSRDDVEAKLLPAYQRLGILPANPFAELDQHGVGRLIELAVDAARTANPGIKLGACGEHAGHPTSAAFLVRLGLDSVSCSPFRVPMARLAVAQALLDSGRVRIDDVEFDFPTTPADPAADTGRDATEVGGATLDTDTDTDIDIDEALVLHVLRIRGFVTPDGFAESLGRHPDEILADLAGRDLVRHVEARDMYGLLPAGKAHQAAMLDSYAPAAVADELAAPYERFLELNDAFKQLCSDWQMRDGEPNDHTDAAYDAQRIADLDRLAADAAPVVAALADAVPRLGRYNRRLATAAECVKQGEMKRFTGVMCESFHDIWMELHEDLIVLQRIDRGEEGSF